MRRRNTVSAVPIFPQPASSTCNCSLRFYTFPKRSCFFSPRRENEGELLSVKRVCWRQGLPSKHASERKTGQFPTKPRLYMHDDLLG